MAAAALQMFLMTSAAGMGLDDDASVARLYAHITGTALPGDETPIEAGPTMPRFAANLTMMFNEWPFLDRFAAAADAGFTAVEFLFPYEHTPDAIAARLGPNGLTQALFNLPPGDWAAGERGLAAQPERLDDLQAGVERPSPSRKPPA